MSFTYDIFLVIALWFLFGFLFLGLFKLFSYLEWLRRHRRPPELGGPCSRILFADVPK